MRFITKEQAWNWMSPNVEKNIPLDKTQFDFWFTRRWFKVRNQKTFSTFLPDQYPPDKPYRMLQIGVFEGYDLAWMMQNCMGHPQSFVLAIDPWLATRKIDQDGMNKIFNRAIHNLSPWRQQIDIMRTGSQDFLSRLDQDNTFDLAVIDGDHESGAVYEDAINCLRLVKPGGWLLFDDVRNQRQKKDHVADGLKIFLEENGDKVQLEWFHRFCNCYSVRAEPDPDNFTDVL